MREGGLSPGPRTLQTLPSTGSRATGRASVWKRHTELVTVTGAIPAALCDVGTGEGAVLAGALSGTTLPPPSHYAIEVGNAQLLIYLCNCLPTQSVFFALGAGDTPVRQQDPDGAAAAVGALRLLISSCRFRPLDAQREGSRTRGCRDTRTVPEVTSRFPPPWLGSTLVTSQRLPDSEGTRQPSWL